MRADGLNRSDAPPEVQIKFALIPSSKVSAFENLKLELVDQIWGDHAVRGV